MQKGFRFRDLLGKVCLSLLLALALPLGATARAEAKAIDVLPGAFGESIDTLDDAISARCIGFADRALRKLLEDFELAAQGIPQGGYLQILQTTLLLPETQPPDATDTERAVWAEIYESTACVVSFVVIDNSLNAGVVPYAEFTGRFGDYAVRQDGSVESVSLRGIRSRFFADPVVPGVRVINMGSHYNTHYTLPDSAGVSDAKLLDGDRVYNIRLGELVYITLTENQTTPYRWMYNLSDDTLVECVFDEYMPDANPMGVPGVGGKHSFHFKATGAGACLVELYLVRIGEDIEQTVQEETYAIFIEE